MTVPLLWLGLHSMAAFSSAIRKATCIFAFSCCKHHHHGHCAAMYDGFYLSDKPNPSRPLWLTRRVTLRDFNHGYCEGFFNKSCKTPSPLTLGQQWFTHERPKYLAWYGWSLALTGKLAPMISGFINTGMGWEWTLVSETLYFCCIW